MKKIKSQQGFTLIELLVVIGILAILLAITLIAINPARQFAQANDTKRRSAITQILNAVGAYMADHKGVFPTALATDPTAADEIKTDAAVGEIDPATTGINLCDELVTDYMPAFPVDPRLNLPDIENAGCAAYASGYSISRAGGRITVTADSEVNTALDTDITVTR